LDIKRKDMGYFDELKESIKSDINSNGKGDITGDKMQSVLLNIVDELGKGASLGETAAQYIKEDDGDYLGEVNGIIAPNDEHYYLPSNAPAEDKVHTFAMVADIPDITIDSELSVTSENAVQNKVLTEALGILEEHLALHSEQIASLDLSMATKTYVDNAIANAITTTLNTEV
jgi:hypothetical protein